MRVDSITGELVAENDGDVREFLDHVVIDGWLGEARHWTFEVVDVQGGFLDIYCRYVRPDRDTGVAGVGFGRSFPLSDRPTQSEVVKTAFLAVKLIIEHEILEAFKWQGKRIFDPHRTLAELTR